MKKLLSLPPNVVDGFHRVSGADPAEWFCTSDPAGHKLGSGAGTAWLLHCCHRAEASGMPFAQWLAAEKRILLHAGGQSRRLPAYATTGKVLTPVPVFRWARGQRIAQNLLDLQMPLYEAILQKAPRETHTLIASGDVLLRATEPLRPVPEADVVCFGLWTDPVQASRHGVFMMDRACPERLDFMLQKPSTEEQARWMPTHLALMDIGVWLLSDRTAELLCRKSQAAQGEAQGADGLRFYDLYSDFGCALGSHPSRPDAELADLRVAVLPLPGGEFYHFGTTPELLSSSLAIQNLVKDQRFIIQKKVKPQPSVFTQNARVGAPLTDTNECIWIENACTGAGWRLSRRNVVTGVPANDWQVALPEGVCVDVVPLRGGNSYALRVYGYDDPFRGAVGGAATQYLGQPLHQWLTRHGLNPDALGRATDMQQARLFPVADTLDELEEWLHWTIAETPDKGLAERWLHTTRRLSADELAEQADLMRQAAQRATFLRENLPLLASNWPRSVFYQTNLKDMAHRFAKDALPLPAPLPADAPLMTRIHDAMFRSEYHGHATASANAPKEAGAGSDRAFALLRDGLTEEALRQKSLPRMTTCTDQLVWGKSPARIDLAGGWTDTPPYCLLTGGNVVNMAIELNGQPPLQVYVKPRTDYSIVCRSIDLGAEERIGSFEELRYFAKVGSPFSIPKAALALAGFVPEFCAQEYPSLRRQLEAFGGGIEVTLFSAIPAGSGLGTSSILAATVLGTLSDFCGLSWDKNEICHRTLILEQLLTTGGGWQDQYGGVLHGIKLLQTAAGFGQNAAARWLPDTLFTDPEYRPCHLLYYTGLTRTAKGILTEIVRGMFLNSTEHLNLLEGMKQHALAMFDAIQRGDFRQYGQLVRTTWEQNKALDSGTNPPAIEALCRRVDDLCLGYKLPGAGGGGYMYMVAKDPQAALRIREMLHAERPAPGARFVEMGISPRGLQVIRS